MRVLFTKSQHQLSNLHRVEIRITCIVLAILISGCRNEAPTHRPWPDADAIFRDKARFRGADSAYSADLGNSRVLWLFGDTFIGDKPKSRSDGIMVRNSIAIQHGYNPETAHINFYMGERDGQAAAFFPHEGATWLWPGPAIKIDEKLLLTFFELELYDGGLGFRAIGSAAFMVSNPDSPPLEWDFERLELPPTPNNVRFGTGALFLEEAYLFAFMAVEPGNHDVYLARWEADHVRSGNLSVPQWFHADQGWQTHLEGVTPIIEKVQTEFSVHRDPESSKLWLVSVDGFGATNIVARTADAPEGPWSAPKFIARPEESDRQDEVYVYSAKVHPHLSGGKTIITYASNSPDFANLVQDMSLYFPRFLRQH